MNVEPFHFDAAPAPAPASHDAGFGSGYRACNVLQENFLINITFTPGIFILFHMKIFISDFIKFKECVPNIYFTE